MHYSDTIDPTRTEPWTLTLTCCGHADGYEYCQTYAEADRFRYDYLNAKGHERSAVVERTVVAVTRARLQREDRINEVVQAARLTEDAKKCANFKPVDGYNCYVEPPQGWAVTLQPCLFCALANLALCCDGQDGLHHEDCLYERYTLLGDSGLWRCERCGYNTPSPTSHDSRCTYFTSITPKGTK